MPGLVLGGNDLSPREVVLVVQREKALAIGGIALAITGGALAGVVHVELRFLQRQADEHLLPVLILGKAALLLEKTPLAGSELDHRGSAAPDGRVAWQCVLPLAGVGIQESLAGGVPPSHGANNRARRKQCGRDERPC